MNLFNCVIPCVAFKYLKFGGEVVSLLQVLKLNCCVRSSFDFPRHYHLKLSELFSRYIHFRGILVDGIIACFTLLAVSNLSTCHYQALNSGSIHRFQRFSCCTFKILVKFFGARSYLHNYKRYCFETSHKCSGS